MLDRIKSTKGVFTGDQDELRPAWVYCLFYAFTQDQPEILIPVSCKSQQISEWVQRFQACHFIPKPGTKHLFPVSCKQVQTFYTGTSSYWSEFVLVSCKYHPFKWKWSLQLMKQLEQLPRILKVSCSSLDFFQASLNHIISLYLSLP